MIKSVGSRLIIKQVKQNVEATSVGGIILSTGDTNTAWGEIVAVGPECGSTWSVGQHIIPVWPKVEHLRIDSVDLFSINVTDILGVKP